MSAVQPQPFLPRRALLALTAVPPLITLVTLPLSSGSVLHQAACLVAQWATALLVGGVLHAGVNAARPRFGAIAATALGQLWVVASLLVVLPLLPALGHAIEPRLATFVLSGAVGLAAAYLLAARAMATLQSRREDALKSRLAALQSQMNPHFLFNGLNAVASLIQLEPSLAESTVERLAGVLQYAIAAGRRGSVKLSEELDVVRDYLDVEQARFGPRIRSRIEVSPELYDVPIPPMLLQPLVENAVLHGLSSKEQGGEVCVSGRLDGSAVVLTVSDDGVGPGGSRRKGNQVGLSSVKERIALTYGEAGAFTVRPRDGGGFECELRLPRAAAA